MNVSERLADYIIGLKYEDLPENVQAIANTAVYNYMGCIFAGVSEPVSQTVLKTIETVGSEGKCRLFGAGRTADPLSAALFNGTAANAIGFDDMYAGGIHHPGTAAITGALTAAQLKKVSGKEFLAAVVAGYEVADRIARMVNPSQYKKFHTACTVGVFGAMVSSAKILGLSREEMVNAFGIAGTQACGLQECSDNMAIRLHHGIASRNGVTASLLAMNGFDGPKQIFEGKGGYVNATSEFDGDMMAQFDDLGEKYLICDTTFKFYPCCGHIHACIDGAIFAMQNSGFKPWNLKKIKVGTYKTAALGDSNPNPENVGQAKFSIEYCVAAGIEFGKCTMGEFQQWPPKKEVLDLMALVEVGINDEIEGNFPAGKRGAVVTLVTDNGEYTEKRLSRRGDPDCPLSNEDIKSKFEGLVAPIMDNQTVQELEELLDNLPQLEDAAALCRF